MDAELQALHAAIALRRCRTAKGRPGERRRLAASDEIYDRELQRLESGSSRPALVCRSAHARAAAKVTKIATTTMVISNASVGIMLPRGRLRGIICGRCPASLIGIKNPRALWKACQAAAKASTRAGSSRLIPP